MSLLKSLPTSFALARWQSAGTTVSSLESELKSCFERKGDPYLATFAKRHTIVNVFLSNHLGFDSYKVQDIYNAVERELDSPSSVALLPEPAPEWSAEGHDRGMPPTLPQLLQYTRALKHIMAIPELTSAELKATHRIMMWGAAGATPGEYRTTTISAPSHVVAPPAAADVPAGSGSSPTGIAAGVEAALGRFNRSLALLVSAGRQLADVNLLAASLAAEVYALRPFPHGNGRLCRLLAAYALMAAGDEAGGDPFPVCLMTAPSSFGSNDGSDDDDDEGGGGGGGGSARYARCRRPCGTTTTAAAMAMATAAWSCLWPPTSWSAATSPGATTSATCATSSEQTRTARRSAAQGGAARRALPRQPPRIHDAVHAT